MRPKPVSVSQGAGPAPMGSSMGMQQSRFMLAIAPGGDNLSRADGGELLQSLQIVVLQS